jgi:hypothetical protein
VGSEDRAKSNYNEISVPKWKQYNFFPLTQIVPFSKLPVLILHKYQWLHFPSVAKLFIAHFTLPTQSFRN